MYDVACDGRREKSERELKMPVRWVFWGLNFVARVWRVVAQWREYGGGGGGEDRQPCEMVVGGE